MRIALVGLGEAGFTIHLPALARVASAEVVGAADLDRTRQGRAAAKFSVPVFAGFDDMLAQTRPDVVLVATPPDTHADYCLKGIAAGAHIICEKPFVSSVEEADAVLEAAARAGRQVAVNHEFREMPIFRAIRHEVVRSGALAFVQIWQLIDLPPGREPGWRGQMTERTLFEAGVHLVDFLMVLFGEKPISVQAAISAAGGPDEAADAIVLATLEFSQGRLAQIVQNRLCKGERQYFEVRADVHGASLRASFGGRSRLSAGFYRATTPHIRVEYGVSGLAWKEVGATRTFLARNPKHPEVVATRRVLEETLEAFETGGKPPTSGRDAREVLEVIAACYRSAHTGRRIRLDEGELKALGAMKMGVQPKT